MPETSSHLLSPTAGPVSSTGQTCGKLESSAIQHLLDSVNNGQMVTPLGVRQALERLGSIKEIGIPFSDAAASASLGNPRVVMTLHPKGFHIDPGVPSTKIAANEPNLYGRLFLGVNLKWNAKARDFEFDKFEFISWNAINREFDFGFLEGIGTKSLKVKLAPRDQCVRCHMTGGPLYSDFNWSNTVFNKKTRAAMAHVFKNLDSQKYASINPDLLVGGFKAFKDADVNQIHGTVTNGNNLLRSHQLPQLIPNSDQRERTLRRMVRAVLIGISAPEEDRIDEDLKDLSWDLKKLSAAKTPLVIDSDPVVVSEPVFRVGAAKTVPHPSSGDPEINRILEYDAKRVGNLVRLPNAFLPSNPNAFSKSEDLRIPRIASEIFNADRYRRASGVTDPDLEVLKKVLDAVVAKMTPGDGVKEKLIDQVLYSRKFSEAFRNGVLPDRDELKAWFVQELNQLAQSKYGVTSLALPKDFLSRKSCEPEAHSYQGARSLASASASPIESCSRCHEGPGVSERLRFTFNPFDEVSRREWLQRTDRAKALEWLESLEDHVFGLQDMPPATAPRELGIRRLNPEAFTELRNFLRRELGRGVP